MSSFADKLLTWFDQHGRKDLPWQENRSPYRVWVSEIMLQQTQVAAVIPFFERFMQRFPGIDDLARATTDEVLHQWTGLGYYARARNLKRAAGIVLRDYNGALPMDAAALQALPGIGRSTANAIVAQCTGQRAAILDGNVKRVLARCFAVEGWPGQARTQKRLWQLAEDLTPQTRVADYTQAIMDLGALVCTRTKPLCDACPLRDDCRARALAQVDAFPGRKPRKTLPVKETVMLFIEAGGEVLLEQRPPDGLWGGLWSLPECPTPEIAHRLDALGLGQHERTTLAAFRHSFTHYHLDITPVHVTCERQPDSVAGTSALRWLDPDHPDEVGLTRPAVRLLQELRGLDIG